MRNTKLITLLSTFSKQEMKEFEKFVDSPFFSKGRNLKPLYKALKKYHPSFNSPHFRVEKIFRLIYPEKKFEGKKSEHIIQVLISEITLLAEKFLVYDAFENGSKGYFRDNNLIYILMERHLNDYALKFSSRVSEELDKMEKTRHYYYERIGMNEFFSSLHALRVEPDKSLIYKQRDITALYAFVFDKICGMINDFLTREFAHNKPIESISLMTDIIKGFDPKKFEKICVDDEYETKKYVMMHYNLSRALLEVDNKSMFEISMSYYLDNFDKFSKQNRFTIYAYLITICNQRLDKDFEFYGRAGHKLSDLFLLKKAYDLTDDAHLPIIYYNSLLNFKIAFLDTEEFKEFADVTLKKIHSVHKNSLKKITYAIYHFKKKEFTKTIELISKMKSPEFYIKNKAQQWRIAAMFELKYYEEALTSIDSYEHFLRYNPKITKSFLKRNIIFSNSVKKLIKIVLENEESKVDVLDEITSLNVNTVFKHWFEEKTEEILCRDQN